MQFHDFRTTRDLVGAKDVPIKACCNTNFSFALCGLQGNGFPDVFR